MIELDDRWAPAIFDEAPELGAAGAQPYRAIYVALADARDDELPADVEPERDLELFGIEPTFRVLRARLGDEARHRCHDAVADAALDALDRTLHASATSLEGQRARVGRVRFARTVLERERAARGLASIEALSEVREARAALAIEHREGPTVDAIAAAQAHLACESLLEAHEPGVLDARTGAALARYQRRHAIVGLGALDASTRAHMRRDSRELDFLAVLRALRERVVDATGAIEDGSARGAWGTVLGRALDAPEMRTLAGHTPLEDGAPDWISAATEAAAIALGWTSPEAARAERPAAVAIRLPDTERPRGRRLELRAVIDRGDVRYERRARPPARRPVLTIYAREGDREVALARWPTTIGGWQPERLTSGRIVMRYKESPVGRRVWRDVVASPAWLPPTTTPDDELVRRVPGLGYLPDTRLVGPGHRSAYGLVMMVHHRPIARTGQDGAIETRLFDEGVRTHGSVSYASILRGSSHGCHRLHNHLAVRLAGFLLAHREHVRHGAEETRYARRVRAPDGTTQLLRVRSRGVRYELVPPVEVEVLEGRIIGRLRRAPEGALPITP